MKYRVIVEVQAKNQIQEGAQASPSNIALALIHKEISDNLMGFSALKRLVEYSKRGKGRARESEIEATNRLIKGLVLREQRTGSTRRKLSSTFASTGIYLILRIVNNLKIPPPATKVQALMPLCRLKEFSNYLKDTYVSKPYSSTKPKNLF
jgi:hypothetical protein